MPHDESSGIRAPRRQALLLAPTTALVLLSPHAGVPMLVYPWLGLGLCWALLRWQHLDFGTLGLRWRACRAQPLLVGGLLGVAYAALNYTVIGPVLARLLGSLPDLGDFDFIRRGLAGYLVALALAWIIGGFYEELVFRGFVRTMLLRHLPPGGSASALAFVLTALLFAAYHAQLGAFGMANALVFAVIAGALREHWPQNLWYVVSFHACADMSAFTLIRFGYL